MTSSARTIRTAIAGALAAAVVLTTVAIPAQAGNKRAPTTTMKPRVTKNPRLTRRPVVKSGHYTALACLKTSGDVMAHPLVINTTSQILPIGKLIVWQAKLANGANIFGTHHLTKPLYVGQSRRIPKQLAWNFTCTAFVFV